MNLKESFRYQNFRPCFIGVETVAVCPELLSLNILKCKDFKSIGSLIFTYCYLLYFSSNIASNIATSTLTTIEFPINLFNFL